MHVAQKIKIVSINIEQDRHFDRLIPFIVKEKPEILLFQEVFEADLMYLEKKFHMKSLFTPLSFLKSEKNIKKLGLAIFSKFEFSEFKTYYYRGDPISIPIITVKEPEKMARALLMTKIVKNNIPFYFINTHFTWSPNATPNEMQHQDLKIMLKKLSEFSECILVGDFNSPRGKIIFDTLKSHYQDHIPHQTTSTLDKNLHAAGQLNLVVDGLFTTQRYYVKNIKIINGISDHCAILAEIIR